MSYLNTGYPDNILLKSGLPWGASGASLNNFVDIGTARGTFVDSIARQKHHSALYISIFLLKGLVHDNAHARRLSLQNKFVGSTLNSKSPLPHIKLIATFALCHIRWPQLPVK